MIIKLFDGLVEVVKYLVENGTDLTADDNQAIRWASRNGHLEVVQYLVENGADLTARDNQRPNKIQDW